MIGIIDYGMGNIHSVNKALHLYGAETIVSNNPLDISRCDKAVLPGVGAFSDAMNELKKQGLTQVIAEFIENRKPFLGICLGMQLLFEESEEAAGIKGLAMLKGRVKKFEEKKGFKIPHMGWNQLNIKYECPLLKNIPVGSYVYFCHSYYPMPSDRAVVASTTDYGMEFASCVWKDNIYGAQFHPEKSQKTGLKIIENFVRLPA